MDNTLMRTSLSSYLPCGCRVPTVAFLRWSIPLHSKGVHGGLSCLPRPFKGAIYNN